METLQHISTTAVCGVILCLVGFLIRYIIGNRRFNRRGIGGLQHYSNYSKALLINSFESLFNLIGFASILFGFFLIAIGWYDSHNTKQPQPTITKSTTKKL